MLIPAYRGPDTREGSATVREVEAGYFFLFHLKLPPLTRRSAEGGMRCVVFTVNCHACVVWPGAPDIVKPASLYTLMFGVSNKVTTSFTYFCVANRAQECSGTSSSTDVAFFQLGYRRYKVGLERGAFEIDCRV